MMGGAFYLTLSIPSQGQGRGSVEFDVLDLVRAVVNPAPIEGGRRLGLSEKEVAFQEEELESSGIRCAGGPGGAEAVVGLLGLAYPPGGVFGPLPLGGSYLGVSISEVEEGSGKVDSEWTICIEREEPDPGSSGFIVDVGSNIELQEVGDPWKRRKEPWANPAHGEGDNSEPSLVLVGVNREALGKAGLEVTRGERPVEKEEAFPRLIEQRGSRWCPLRFAARHIRGGA